MTKLKWQFDRGKYLNNPLAPTDEQHARLQLAREEAQQRGSSIFLLRAAASLTLSSITVALVGWLAGWSILETGIVIAACVMVWAAATILVWRYLYRGPRSS